MRSEFDKTPHEVRYSIPLKSKHEYQLQRTQGECLVAAGLPEKATAIINRTGVDPRPGDLVWVDNHLGTIHGFIKQVKSFENGELLVTTNYEDPSRNFEFYATTYYGVVEFAFNALGDLCYKREEQNDEQE